MNRAELEKRIRRLHKGGTGILKIGKTLGIGTGTMQRVLMEQPRPFDIDVAEAAFASHVNGRSKAARVPGGVGCAEVDDRFALKATRLLGSSVMTRR